MDINAILTVARQFAPSDLAQKGLAAIGALSLLGQVLPKLVGWGVPAAIRSADWLAKAALNSPARPLILWKANDIAGFLDNLSSALTMIMNTFKNQLEADIKASATPTPPLQGPPKP